MQPCPEALPTLPPGFLTLPPEVALRAVLRAKMAADAEYFECRRKHNRVVDHIKDNKS